MHLLDSLHERHGGIHIQRGEGRRSNDDVRHFENGGHLIHIEVSGHVEDIDWMIRIHDLVVSGIQCLLEYRRQKLDRHPLEVEQRVPVTRQLNFEVVLQLAAVERNPLNAQPVQIPVHNTHLLVTVEYAASVP